MSVHAVRKFHASQSSPNCNTTKQGKLSSTHQSHCSMVMGHMTDVLHVGIFNPCIAICERGMQSHQALLLQAQDDKVEDQDTECQDAAIQYPELADIMGQEVWNDQVLPQHSYNRIPTICQGSNRQSSWHNTRCNGNAQHWTADAARYMSSC